MPKKIKDSDAIAFSARLARVLEMAGQQRHGAGAYLAKRYKVSTVTANAWLNGEHKPAIELARRIAEEHGSTFDAMYFGNGDLTPVSKIEETRAEYALPRQMRVQVMGTAYMDKAGFWTDLVDDPDGNGYFTIGTDDPNAYAVRIRANGDAPLGMSGWYIVLMPSLRPDVGMHVLVRLRDGRCTVKEFLWHREGEYAFQGADGGRLVLPEGDVEYVHCMAGAMMPNQLKR